MTKPPLIDRLKGLARRAVGIHVIVDLNRLTPSQIDDWNAGRFVYIPRMNGEYVWSKRLPTAPKRGLVPVSDVQKLLDDLYALKEGLEVKFEDEDRLFIGKVIIFEENNHLLEGRITEFNSGGWMNVLVNGDEIHETHVDYTRSTWH